MRQFQASAVERRKHFRKEFSSHPMEAGWAGEAIFYLIVEEVNGEDATLDTEVEISADGVNWIPEGTKFPPINATGHYFARVSHFGNWLRVRGVINDERAMFKLSVHLHLKS